MTNKKEQKVIKLVVEEPAFSRAVDQAMIALDLSGLGPEEIESFKQFCHLAIGLYMQELSTNKKDDSGNYH